MISLTTSVNDLILQRTLMESTLGLNQTINRLTTGYKLNHAKDNAAGYSISTDLNKKISSMLMIQQNTSEGIDLIATAEGGLDQILTHLQRLRALSMDAANGTYDSQSRDAMQSEVDSIMESIDKIKSSTTYNNINLFQTVTYSNDATAGGGGGATFSLRRANLTSPLLAGEGEGEVETTNSNTTPSPTLPLGEGEVALTSLDGEEDALASGGVNDETTTSTTPSPTLPLGEGERSVTNFSTIQLFNPSTLLKNLAIADRGIYPVRNDTNT